MACNMKIVELPECTDLLYIPVGIEATYGDLLNSVITDKFGNKYTDVATINEDGFLVLNTNSAIYPKGLFNRYAGAFTLEILNGCDVLTLTLCDTEYKSYQLEFYKEENQQETFTVCCN